MDKNEYQEYLKSDHWIKLSNDVKNQSDHRCRLCNSKMNLQVHHRSYLWVGNYEKEINDLVCLCEACHSNHHGIRKVTVLPNYEKPPHGIGRVMKAKKKGLKGFKTFNQFCSNKRKKKQPKRKVETITGNVWHTKY